MYQTGFHATGYHETNYYLRGVVIAFVPGGGLDEYPTVIRKRDTDDLEILLIMVAIIENDR